MEIVGGDELIPLINHLMDEFEEVVAANFSLPHGHLAFAVNHPWRKPGQVIRLNGQDVELEIMYCVQDSFGASFAPGLNVDRIGHTVEMAAEVDAIPHSAFYDAGHRRSTGLQEYLSALKVDTLYVCGMPFDPIVVNSAIDARNLGYKVQVVQSACRLRQPQRLNELLHRLAANDIAVS